MVENLSNWNNIDWLDEGEEHDEQCSSDFLPVDTRAYITVGDLVSFRDNLPSYLFHSHRVSKKGLPSCVRGMKDDNGNDIGKNSKFYVKRVVNRGKGVVICVGGIDMYWDISLFSFVGVG